jgi:hypothetical protein
LTSNPLLHKLNGKSYFKEILPTIIPRKSKKRKYKLAYTLLILGDYGVTQLSQLLELLDDNDAVILIQTDKRLTDKTLAKIKDVIDNQVKTMKHSNIYLSEYRYSHVRSHISFVYSYLSGFFELRDLADWDYIINLSNYDWPLRRNAEIHRILDINPGKSYFNYWPDTYLLALRAVLPHLSNNARYSNYHSVDFSLFDPLFSSWVKYRTNEWMILSPSAVDFLRKDEWALNYLAIMEHTDMPTESYFATGIYSLISFDQ